MSRNGRLNVRNHRQARIEVGLYMPTALVARAV